MNSRRPATRNIVRPVLGAAIACALAVAASACGSSASSGSGSSGSNKATIIYGTSSLLYAPLQVAQAEGYFKKAGVNVNLVASSSGNAALEAAIGGSGSIVASGLSNDVIVAAKGHALDYFATLASHLPNNIIISSAVAKQKGITAKSTLKQKVEALKGLTIGDTGAGSVTDQVLQWTLQRYGINPKTDVQIVSLGGDSATAVAGLVNGKVQALLYPAPTPEELYSSGKGQLLVNFAAGEVQPPPGYMLGLMAASDYIKGNPAIIKGVIKAVNMAESFMHSNQAKAEADLQTYFKGVNKKVFDQAYVDELPTVPSKSTVDTAGIQPVIDFVKQFSSVSGVTVKELSGPVG